MIEVVVKGLSGEVAVCWGRGVKYRFELYAATTELWKALFTHVVEKDVLGIRTRRAYGRCIAAIQHMVLNRLQGGQRDPQVLAHREKPAVRLIREPTGRPHLHRFVIRCVMNHAP